MIISSWNADLFVPVRIAVGAEAVEINLGVGYDALAVSGHYRLLERDVADGAALGAPEMSVGLYIGVEMGIPGVDGDDGDGSLFGKKLQGIVYGGLRKRGHLGREGCIDVVDRGMGVMVEQVFHKSHSLGGGSYVAFYEIILGLFHYNIVIITI